jgi:hypothetical protein
VLDLGLVKIPQALRIYASVTDMADQPLEGIAVIARDQYGKLISNTDENGIAIFNLAQDSKGVLAVEYTSNDTASEESEEKTAFDINGPEDANSIFSIKVSPEMLK